MICKKIKKIPFVGPLLKDTYYALYSLYVRFLNCFLRKKYYLVKKPEQAFEVVRTIQGRTWNTMYTPEIFELSKERTITAIYPELEFYRIPNAVISLESDVIRTNDTAWWDKYNDEDFVSLAQPRDKNVVRFDKSSIIVSRKLRKEYIHGNVISLIGVFSSAWSHFLFEFVCKLYFAGESGLLNQKVTLLTNEYHDENIEYILSNYLKDYPLVNRIILKKNKDYYCDTLFAMRCTGTNYNEAKVFWDYRLIIPKIVIDRLHQYVSNPLISKVKDNQSKYKKLFLARHSNRKLTNNNEVEAYFKEQGFFFVEGFELSIEEKVDLFYHADIIVGLHSSAWQNIIFCNNAKCLMFVNNRYAPEMLFYTMAKDNVSKWLNVCGQDVNDDRRSDYYIPLDKIKRAYSQLLAE